MREPVMFPWRVALPTQAQVPVPSLDRVLRLREDRQRGFEAQAVPNIGPQELVGYGQEQREDDLPDRPLRSALTADVSVTVWYLPRVFCARPKGLTRALKAATDSLIEGTPCLTPKTMACMAGGHGSTCLHRPPEVPPPASASNSVGKMVRSTV